MANSSKWVYNGCKITNVTPDRTGIDQLTMYHRPSRQTIVLMHFHPSQMEAHTSSQVVHQPLDGSRHSLIMTVIGIRIARMILSLTMAETYFVKRADTSLGVVLL